MISLKNQLLSILFSILFSIIYSYLLILIIKKVNTKNTFYKVINNILYNINFFIIFFIILKRFNYGIFHYYDFIIFLLVFIKIFTLNKCKMVKKAKTSKYNLI